MDDALAGEQLLGPVMPDGTAFSKMKDADRQYRQEEPFKKVVSFHNRVVSKLSGGHSDSAVQANHLAVQHRVFHDGFC